MKALIINFNGLGNGITILPILKCIEDSLKDILYWHNENPILQNDWFNKKVDLKKLSGLVPAKWRRFAKEDWADIVAFSEKNRINIFINVRNEGPVYDVGYYQFKQWITDNKKYQLEFWDLDFEKLSSRKNHRLLTQDILTMLKRHGIRTELYDPQWISRQFFSAGKEKLPQGHIGLFTGAGQVNKRWSTKEWQTLAQLFAEEKSHMIEIYSGTTASERCNGRDIYQSIKKEFPQQNCLLIENKTIEDIAESFWKLNLLVSGDTFAVPLASALNVPVIGLYFVTSAAIWGGDSRVFRGLQSKVALECPGAKVVAGNCKHFYGICPTLLTQPSGITPQAVFTTAKSMLKVFSNKLSVRI